jgi:hypothetical protein
LKSGRPSTRPFGFWKVQFYDQSLKKKLKVLRSKGRSLCAPSRFSSSLDLPASGISNPKVLRSSEEIMLEEQPKYTKKKIAQFFMVQEQPKNRKEKNAHKKSAMLYV